MSFKIPDTPEELFRQGRKGFDKFNNWLPGALVVLILAIVALSSFYTVAAEEVGVIRRFGKYIRTTQPGLHWKWPVGIEQLNKVKVKRIFKDEFGFRTVRPGVRTQYASGSAYDDESLMLTGDLNVLDISWIAQYKVKDPVKFLFNIRNPRETMRDVSEAVMRQVVGDSAVSETLTSRRIVINNQVQERMQEILDNYDSGIHIETVKLQDVNPPDKVKPSFNAVNEAKQEKEKLINQAWEAYNKAIPRARGEAEKNIREAEGYALSRVNAAKGEAAKFVSVWKAYTKAKAVTRRRLYLETMAEMLPNAGQVFIMEPEQSQVLPLLNLQKGRNRE